MYTGKHWFVIGMAGAICLLAADAAYGAGFYDGKASASVDSEPSPDEAETVEPDDSPSPTESDGA